MGVYGIDLGTTTCLVAEVVQDLDGAIDVECLSDEEGNESFPSVVYFENDNSYKVGDSAVEKLMEEPESTVELVKIRLGKIKTIDVSINGNIQRKTPQEICAYMLRHLNYLYQDKIREAILTVPAFFEQAQKDSTIQVGEVANLKITEMIEEPVAAIMYHIFYEYKKQGISWLETHHEKNILVFDFGGGTLDLSLVRMHRQGNELKPTVLALGGNNNLGGNIIDFVFTKYALEYLEEMYPDDIFISEVVEAYNGYYTNYIENGIIGFEKGVSSEVKKFISRLKIEIESVKCNLSDVETEHIVFERSYKAMKITRREFEEEVLRHSTLNIQQKIEDTLRDMLWRSHNNVVDEVLFVGGSSRIPRLREIVKKAFQKFHLTDDRIICCDEYDNAIAKGAAIVAAIEKGIAVEPFFHNRCRSIVPRTIKVKTISAEEEFIQAGTEYPLAKKYDIKVGHALSEEVNIKLTEMVRISRNQEIEKEICKLTFYLPIYYTGDDIEVSMAINKTGMYQIKAIHKVTNEQIEYEPERLYALQEKEVIRLAKAVQERQDKS